MAGRKCEGSTCCFWRIRAAEEEEEELSGEEREGNDLDGPTPKATETILPTSLVDLAGQRTTQTAALPLPQPPLQQPPPIPSWQPSASPPPSPPPPPSAAESRTNTRPNWPRSNNASASPTPASRTWNTKPPASTHFPTDIPSAHPVRPPSTDPTAPERTPGRIAGAKSTERNDTSASNASWICSPRRPPRDLFRSASDRAKLASLWKSIPLTTLSDSSSDRAARPKRIWRIRRDARLPSAERGPSRRAPRGGGTGSPWRGTTSRCMCSLRETIQRPLTRPRKWWRVCSW
mmetsp:Transcript_13814/g.23562  ORF Transcript_13814/g.23562 Transcript_13814/m.23562 type:complete len:290 (+) Transcript_13814:294-1163(+)